MAVLVEYAASCIFSSMAVVPKKLRKPLLENTKLNERQFI